jgi:surfeit locus 1 family protein
MLCLTLAAMAVTASLGRWQLSRAAEKEAAQMLIENRQKEVAVNNEMMLQNPGLGTDFQRNIELEGFWSQQHTLLLDNRTHQGKTGFWVMTPLLLDANTAVLVQRGWIARNPVNIYLVPNITTSDQLIRIHGRIIGPPSHMMELSNSAHNQAYSQAESTKGSFPIMQNLSMEQLSAQTGLKILAVVLQTDPSDAELTRDWAAPNSTADRNRGYAFQWFAMTAVIFSLFVWFQIIQVFRHGRLQQH